MSSNLADVAKYLVYQQFYDEDDKVVFDRTKKIRLLIPGVDHVIPTCLQAFTQAIPLIQEKKYHEYLEQIAQKLPFDIDIVEPKFLEMKEKLGEQELSETMVATFLIGEILNYLRDVEFTASKASIKKQLMEKSTSPAALGFIEMKISKFGAVNDLNISLIYNLSFLRLLVAQFDPPEFPELKSKIDQMIQKYAKALMEQITRGSIHFK